MNVIGGKTIFYIQYLDIQINKIILILKWVAKVNVMQTFALTFNNE